MNRHRYSTYVLLAGCGWFLATPSTSAQKVASGQQDSTFGRGISASPGGVLTVDLASGGSLVVRGWERDSVRVRAHLAGRDWRDTKVHLDRTPEGVRLRTSLGGSALDKSTSHEFEIWVPTNTDIELESAGGDVRMANVSGTFRGQTRGGSIQLERVRGHANLSTRGGAILISDSHLDGSVTTRGGPVSLERVSGGVRTAVETGSFDDKTHKDQGRDVRRIDSRGGPIELDEAPNGAVLHTNGGSIRLTRSLGAVEATTGSGSIEIGPTFGPVIARTGMGDVQVTLARNLTDTETTDLTSGTGTVILQLPPDYAGILDLQAGYTNTFGRAARIQSEWPLGAQTTGPVTNGGTSQRYVRAVGSVGSARGRIRVRTTNGDIIVRRAP